MPALSRYHHLLDYTPSWALARTGFRLLRPSRAGEIEQARRGESGPGLNVVPFFRHRCIFIHIPKTAGISVVNALFGQAIGMSHTRIRTFRILLTADEYDGFFKFCFVRHPVTRLRSAYGFLRTGGITKEDRAWAEAVLERYPSFESFVLGWLSPAAAHDYYHFVPQADYVVIRGVNQMDFIGRFESLAEDYERLRTRLGTGAALPHINRSKAGNAGQSEALSPKVIDRIAEIYAMDFELFGYAPEPA